MAQKETTKLADEQNLVEVKRSFKDMIYGASVAGSDERMPDSFIFERRPGQRYLVDIKKI